MCPASPGAPASRRSGTLAGDSPRVQLAWGSSTFDQARSRDAATAGTTRERKPPNEIDWSILPAIGCKIDHSAHAYCSRRCWSSRPGSRSGRSTSGTGVAVSGRLLLAVEVGESPVGVAAPGGGAGRERVLDPLEILSGQLELERAERLVQALAAAGADERHDVVAAAEHPGDRYLRHARVPGVGDLAQRVDEGQVVLQVLALEARAD